MSRRFWRRFKIEGRLTAAGPLHVGAGAPRRIAAESDDGQAFDVDETVTDFRGKPYLPAATIKGVFRGQAVRWGLREVDALFGPPPESDGAMGLLYFRDAPMAEAPAPPAVKATGSGPPMHWDEARSTFITAHTAVDRVTRTARRHKLYHREFVAPGAGFEVEIDAEGLSDSEIANFLRLLDRLQSSGSLQLGAWGKNSCGGVEWRLSRLSGLRSPDEVRIWLSGNAVGFEQLPEISIQEVLSEGDFEPRESRQVLEIELEIRFEGPFLVNDPTLCRETGSEVGEGANHDYLRSFDGRILLPAKSFRGALRAQAERIARTVSGKEDACFADDTVTACKPGKPYCVTCRLFGGNGWAAALQISDFLPSASEGLSAGKPDGVECTQEFVAIDRFTGGGSERKKFNARYRYKPILSGKLRLDLTRIEARHAGLLILALRDLIEGDVTFGLGRSKGFGACRAAIRRLRAPEALPDWLRSELGSEDRSKLLQTEAPLRESQLLTLQSLVDAFRTAVNQESD